MYGVEHEMNFHDVVSVYVCVEGIIMTLISNHRNTQHQETNAYFNRNFPMKCNSSSLSLSLFPLFTPFSFHDRVCPG